MIELQYGRDIYGKRPDDAVCELCPHPATETVIRPGNDGIHFAESAGSWLCEHCFTELCIDYAEKQAARLPELREKLAQACRYDRQHGNQEDDQEDHPRFT